MGHEVRERGVREGDMQGKGGTAAALPLSADSSQ